MTLHAARPLAAVLSIGLTAALVTGLPAQASPGTAQATVSEGVTTPRSNTFPERYSVNAAGDLVITGNTLMTCPLSASTCAQAQRGGGTSSSFNNNSYSMVMVDIDDDPSTVNSSSADLLIPAGAPILFAGLYWGAGASGDQAKGLPPANAATIQLRLPSADAYTPITGAVTTISTSGSNKTYAAFADVTAQVRGAGRGTYVVADVKGDLGVNHFAGWSLIVVYGDPTEPVRAMSVFDGLVSVSSGSPATIAVSGFRTPPTGPVRTALGVVAYEGDLGITGDQFLLDGKALSDTRRPSGNYFNSSITTLTGRFSAKSPDYVNQLGFDTGLIDATGRIPNNATSATFRASSTGDQYYPAALTFSTELFSPRFAALKSVVDVNGDAVRAGDELDYSLVLTNDVTVDNGDASTNTIITDILPAGATYVAGSLQVDGVSVPDSGSIASFADGTLTLRVGEGATATTGGRLAIGQSVIVTYRMRVAADTAPGSILANDFRVAGTAATSGFDVTGVSNETSLTVVADDADLSIAKSVSPSTLIAGGQATYTLRASNAGPGSAQSLVVTDTIPDTLTLVSATGSGWSCVETTPTVRCTLPALAAGASAAPITVTVGVKQQAAQAAEVSNTATVSSSSPDPDPSGNTSTVTVPVSASADLAINKWHDGAATPGATITYSIGVRNNGPSVATGVTVTDLLPAYLRLVSVTGDGWTCTNAVECSLTSPLPAGSSSGAITLVAEVLGNAPAEVANTASVKGDQTDPTPGNNTATDTAETSRVFDGIESLSHPGKAIPGGPAVPVTVRSFNAGPGAVPAGADAIQTITLPRGTALVGHSGAGWSCIPSTGSATTAPLIVRCTLPLTQAWDVDTSLTPLVLQVSVAAGETQDKTVVGELTTTSSLRDIDPDNNRASDIITLETDADLAITTTSSATLAAGGPSRPITFTVRNNGPVADPGPIRVRFSRLTTLQLRAAAGSAWTCTDADGRTTCTLTGTTLLPGATAPALTLDVSAPDPETLPRTYDLTGIVSSPQPDSNPANDAATAPISVTKDAGIWTSKTATPTRVIAGDTVTFTLTVSNAPPFGGPSAARDVYLTDDFGAVGLSVESVSPVTSGLDCSASTSSVVKCYQPLLDFGQEASVRVVARTDPSWTTPGRTFTNVVTATSSSPGGDRPPGQVTVTTDPSSEMKITKAIRGRAAGSQIVPGSKVTYTLNIDNAGPTNAAGATVVDVMPSTLVPRAATGDGWTCTITGQRVSCSTDALLPVGEAISPIFVTALVLPDASGAIINGAEVEPQSPGTGDRTEVTHLAGDFLDLDVAHYGPTSLRAGDNWPTTVAVRNNGPATEPGPIRVVVQQRGDTPRSASGDGWRCTIDGRRITCTTPGPLAMGQSLPPISIVGRTPASGVQADSVATVSGQRDDVDRSNNRSATSAVLVRDADLAVRKAVRKSPVVAGGKATYIITLRNLGPGSSGDAQIVDGLPAGFTFDRRSSDSRCTNEDLIVQCSAGRTLGAGESTRFRIVARVGADVRGTVPNTVIASSSQPDPRPSNNRDRVSITVIPALQDQVPLVEPPRRIKDRGLTELFAKRPPTNAGQAARVQVTCQPLVQRQPRGDFEYCRVVTRANGSIWIDIRGGVPLMVTVRLTAPAVPGYSAMDVRYRYRTG